MKNSGKGTKRSIESSNEHGAANEKKQSSDKRTVVSFRPTLTRSAAATYHSYLSWILSSLWRSEGTKEMRKTTVKTQRIKPVGAPKSALFERTKSLVSKLLSAETDGSVMLRTRELCKHFMDYPEARIAGFEEAISRKLKLCLRRTNDEVLREHIRQFLVLMGDVRPPPGAGIRVLSLDGGGMRGMLGIDVLQALEKNLEGLKVVEAFDLIVGVSTGAIIGALLAAKRLSVEMCKEVYIEISRELFSQDKFSGVSGLLLSHAYYNTEKWKQLLKKVIGEETLLEICGRWETPKLCVVSCIVNTPTLQPYIFRTYGHRTRSVSHYRGGCNHKVWEALQASAAAPGYFEEVLLGMLLHQDGGILTNNPTALAVHEARKLWPEERIQCVVSVGNGRTVSEVELTGEKLCTRLQEKILRIIDSATDTELVDLCMRDALPKGSYMRFNPYTSYPYSLDEIDPKKMEQMGRDAQLYILRNQAKFEATAKALLAKPPLKQRFVRNLKELTLP